MYINTLFVQIILGLVIALGLIPGLISYMILLERKTAAWIQDRVGPNRVGPYGLLQPIVDGVKFILKEEFIPAAADKGLFILAPIAILTPALCGFAVIPWGGQLEAGTAIPTTFPGLGWKIPFIGGYSFQHNWDMMVANPDIGVLFVLAMAGLATYGVVLGGYASGSKYSFLGGLRATAQMLSYEVPMAVSLLAIIVVAGTMRLGDVVAQQADYSLGFIPHWNVFMHPIAFLIFVTCIFAEANRTPFDLAECESELVGGYHTEYSSMKFALFFLAEYAAMITGSAVAVALFLGGWHLPWLDLAIYGDSQIHHVATGWGGMLLKFVVFWGKVVVFLFFYMWMRWTLPRFRFDQLMNLAWRGMVPLSLGSFLIAALVVHWKNQGVITHVGLWLFLLNMAFFFLTIGILSLLPRGTRNPRIMLPRSRYNPQLVRPAAALEMM
jgi:NADH-quinone oxidoreductase subunit H